MNFLDALIGFLIFSLLILAFLPAVMSLEKINPIVNLTLANATQSQLYGINEDVQQLTIRRDCQTESWSSALDNRSVIIVVEAECKGQPLNIGRFIYIGY